MMFNALFVTLCILTAVDSYSTAFMLRRFKGIHEKNPIMRWLLNVVGYNGFVVITSVLKVGILIWIYYVHYIWLVLGLSVVFAYADFNNIKLLVLFWKLSKARRHR